MVRRGMTPEGETLFAVSNPDGTSHTQNSQEIPDSSRHDSVSEHAHDLRSGSSSTRNRRRPTIVCKLSVEAVPELYEIELECNRPPWSPALIAAEFTHAHARVFGVRVGGQIAGFLVAHIVLDEAHILNVGVRSSFRGEGVGRGLLRESLSLVATEGVRTVTLEVRQSNMVARAMYASFGFGEAGVRPRYYADNGEDAITMRLSMDDFLRSEGDRETT